MLSNVTHSHFYFECNKERGPIDQLYIELGLDDTFFGKGTFLISRSTVENIHTVKLQAVDRPTIQFWNFMAKGHST